MRGHNNVLQPPPCFELSLWQESEKGCRKLEINRSDAEKDCANPGGKWHGSDGWEIEWGKVETTSNIPIVSETKENAAQISFN